MIKLYNHSAYPDELLLPLLNYAKKITRCKGDIVVKVTKGGYRVTSEANKADFVKRWFLGKQQYTKASGRTKLKKGLVATSGGYVILRPKEMFWIDALEMAEVIFRTMVHEFCHIRDMQIGERFSDYNRQWKNRPHEIRAVYKTKELMNNIPRDAQEAILNLGIFIEASRKRG